MIHVKFVEPDSVDWKEWKREAEEARDQLVKAVAAGSKVEIKAELYKKMKQVIFQAFNGKCAYCETRIVGSDQVGLDQPGDVEHFRPKGRVVGDDGKEIQVRSKKGDLANHPGYYWLAYDWTNLLPSCATCNRPAKTPEGKLIGKWDRFPVRKARATEPGDEAQEEPLFFNPLRDRPEEELVFDEETGVIAGTSDRGKASVEMLGLNREGLRSGRRDIYQAVQLMTNDALQKAMDTAEPVRVAAAAKLKILNEHLDGKRPYSFAARKAVRDAENRSRELWARLERRASRPGVPKVLGTGGDD